MRWWAFRRRLLYGFGFFVVCAFIGGGLYSLYGYVPANCFDTKQNGSETGVDCGGGCVRMCTQSVQAPVTKWVRAFRILPGMYNAVAYIENRNPSAGVANLGYTIRLSDAQGVIVERKGTTPLPPNTVYPLFEGRINTGNRVPTETAITFDTDPQWVRATNGGERFTLERRELTSADQKPVLTATLKNETPSDANDVDVVATIFDRGGTALTASRTKIPVFPGRSTRDVTFTWPEPIAKTLRSCEVPSDIVLALDLSGSMNNDGGTPPEPMTSVLIAARAFALRLGEHDQAALVTYATKANTVEPLTNDHTLIAKTIGTLAIDPKEEQGSTNTGEALKRALEEISTTRHNVDARTVVILLTDGLATAPDPDPEAYAREVADALKAAGVEVFTIGLGKELNEAFLTSIATDEKHYFQAPSVATLRRIYEDITGAICEEGAAVIDIVPKQSGIFTPINPQ